MKNELSDALASLSAKTRIIEDKIAAANQATKEEIQAQIFAAKSKFEAGKDEFIAKGEAIITDEQAKENQFKEKMHLKTEHLKAVASLKKAEVAEKIGEVKHELKVDAAETNYADAVYYAMNCIEWAEFALNDVDEAALEVISAKIKLEEAISAV